MSRGLKGLGGNGVTFMALCDDTFWDDLIAHPEVRETYLGQQEAAQLRGASAWESFNFGGITWTNYRGTDDDNSTVAIGAGKIKMFPVGAGIFQWAMSPGEQFDTSASSARCSIPASSPTRPATCGPTSSSTPIRCRSA
jgi:hypothetical protein